MLERNTQINHAVIGAVATPFNPLFRWGVVGQVWNLGTVAGLASLNAEVTRQATMIAYLDDFRFMMMAALVLAPLALFFGRIHRRQEASRVSSASDLDADQHVSEVSG